MKKQEMKPELPRQIAALLPQEVVNYIYSFVPHIKKAKSPPNYTLSPQAARDLRLIQSSTLKGRNSMYMRDLEDFILS